jgi:hypothetical protein
MGSFENMCVAERLERCLVVGCCVSAGRGWACVERLSEKALAQWMNDRCGSVCQFCSCSVAAGRTWGNHAGCAAQATAMHWSRKVDVQGHLEDGWKAGAWAARLRKQPASTT